MADLAPSAPVMRFFLAPSHAEFGSINGVLTRNREAQRRLTPFVKAAVLPYQSFRPAPGRGNQSFGDVPHGMQIRFRETSPPLIIGSGRWTFCGPHALTGCVTRRAACVTFKGGDESRCMGPDGCKTHQTSPGIENSLVFCVHLKVSPDQDARPLRRCEHSRQTSSFAGTNGS